MQDYPIAIVQDRYGGVYSRGAWLAVGEFDARDGSGYAVHTRLDYVMEHAHGDDVTAMLFWTDVAPGLRWLAVGATPDEALANLRARTRRSGSPARSPIRPSSSARRVLLPSHAESRSCRDRVSRVRPSE
ncbi:MAG TPA: hypothetical protein VLK84_22275 [Longimicrobium sp.]|nr:hypothetical protein [Longimicrobium sp.]